MNATRILTCSVAVAAVLSLAACGDDDVATDTVPEMVDTGASDAAQTDLPTVESASALLINMSEADAEAATTAEGWILRVARRDGEELAGTMDLQPERVNVEVTNGMVTAVTSIG